MTKVNWPSSAPCKMDDVWTKNMFLLYSYHARWMVCGQETCSCSIPILLLNTMVSNNIVTIVGILFFKNLQVLVSYIFKKFKGLLILVLGIIFFIIDLQVQFWA